MTDTAWPGRAATVHSARRARRARHGEQGAAPEALAPEDAVPEDAAPPGASVRSVAAPGAGGTAAAPGAPPGPPGAPAPPARPSATPGRGRTRRARRLPAKAPATTRCMVLSCSPDDTVAVEFATGAIIRLRVDWGEGREPDFTPFEVVDAVLAGDLQRDDLAQPEAVSVEGVPEHVGELGGRRARRVLRHLVAPTEQHLLGFPGTSAPYWQFRGMRPSVALVVPSRGPLLFRRRTDDSIWVRFGWPRSDNWLPVEDRRAMAALWATRRDRLSGKDLANALGFRPHFLVVALSKPVGGHCYKTVTAILPRP